MYSRSRMAGREERYTENLPTVYNGNRFSYARREHTSNPPPSPPQPQEPEEIEGEEIQDEDIHREDVPEKKEDYAPPSPLSAGGILSGIGQEEVILLALLLLLSAEHERSMDVIVILLLLIGIH